MIEERIPLSRVRRRIGDHMVKSLDVSPHVTMSVDVDYHAIEQLRQEHGPTWSEGHNFSLTYLPFVARSLCDGLKEFPDLNASIDDNTLVRWGSVNLGIAVDLAGEGLIVPVLRRCEDMTAAQLAEGAHEVASAAVERRLSPDDVRAATFTITSPGATGADRSTPIINQPQVAILAIDAIRDRPAVVDDGIVGVRPIGALSLSFDHRAVDGVYASSFLRAIQELLETEERGPDV